MMAASQRDSVKVEKLSTKQDAQTPEQATKLSIWGGLAAKATKKSEDEAASVINTESKWGGLASFARQQYTPDDTENAGE